MCSIFRGRPDIQDDSGLTTTAPSTTTTAVPSLNMTYWVSFSKRIRFGAPLAVSVHAPHATGPFTLILDLMDYSGRDLQDGQNFTLQATGNLNLWISIPSRVNGRLSHQSFTRNASILPHQHLATINSLVVLCAESRFLAVLVWHCDCTNGVNCEINSINISILPSK